MRDEDDNTAGLAQMTREKYALWVQEQRKRVERVQRARHGVIQRFYKPLHQELWQFSRDFFDPAFLACVDAGTEEAVRKFVTKEAESGVYSFPMCSPEFCKRLLEEVDHFARSGLPSSFPNTMNNYGVILDDLGLTDMVAQVRIQLIVPLAKHLFPRSGGATLDQHHAFCVEYSMSTERELGFHYDASDVTLNVCLGETFTGGELFFRGLLEDESTHGENFVYNHVVGRAVLHIGRHRHGALELKSGRRLNLIVWCRSSEFAEAQHSHSHEHGGGSCHGHHHHEHEHNHDHSNHDDDDDDDGSEPVIHIHSDNPDDPVYTAVLEDVPDVQFQVIGFEEE